MTHKHFLSYSDLNKNIVDGFAHFNEQSVGIQKKLKKIQKKYQEKLYSGLLYRMTYLMFDTDEAKKIWTKILDHSARLEKKLGRSVDIEVAALDYLFMYDNTLITHPVIVEEEIIENIKKKVLVDDLTGLFNYRYYKIRVREEISKSIRYKQPFSLIVFDIDDFKVYNDRFGHLEGNKVLIQIAGIMKRMMRYSDILIRFGGEEFVMLLPNTDKKGAMLTANRFRQRVEKMHFKKQVTISGGVAAFLEDTKDNENELFKFADLALYRAKYEGKNRICNYPEERRNFKRINDATGRYGIKFLSKEIVLKSAKNISRGGLCITSTRQLTAGQPVAGIVLAGNDEISFSGQVRWSKKAGKGLFESGIKFFKAKENLRLLKTLKNKKQKRKSKRNKKHG